MPGGDRTGPWGYGPRTGRAMGYCSRRGVPGFVSSGGFGGRFGRGFGRGLGLGRGRSPRAAYAPPDDVPLSVADEVAYLQDVQMSLERDLEGVRKRLEELAETHDEK